MIRGCPRGDAAPHAGGYRRTMEPPITVVVADDQALVRAGFRAILEARPGIAVVGEAADGADAVDLARRRRPAVVLMDIRMPGMDGIEATRRILADPDAGDTAILMLTTFDHDAYVYDALRAGAAGFLLKDVPPEGLIEAVRVVAAGDGLIAPAVTRRLIAQFARSAPPSAPPAGFEDLTPREVEVLAFVARGHTNAEIAGVLVLSEATVKTPREADPGQAPCARPRPGGRARLRGRPRHARRRAGKIAARRGSRAHDLEPAPPRHPVVRRRAPRDAGRRWLRRGAARGERRRGPHAGDDRPLRTFDAVGPMPYAALQGMFESPSGSRRGCTARRLSERADPRDGRGAGRPARAQAGAARQPTAQPLGGAFARMPAGATPLDRRGAPWAWQAGAAWFDPAADAAVAGVGGRPPRVARALVGRRELPELVRTAIPAACARPTATRSGRGSRRSARTGTRTTS